MLLSGFKRLRPPQNTARVVAAQRGKHKRLVRAYVSKAAINPSGHGANITRAKLGFRRLRVKAPMKLPSALGANKHFGREVHVRRVRHAVRHGHAANLKAMVFAQANRLIRVLRHACAYQGVVFLRAAAGDAVVNEGIGAVAQA